MEQTPTNIMILTGLRVVEIGHFISVPLIGMVLADQGADVLRISPPSEEIIDQGLDQLLSRNKKKIAYSAISSQQMKSLLSEADILIINLPEHKLGYWDLDFEKIQSLNQRLIISHVPGFPTFDERNEIAAFTKIIGMSSVIYEKVYGTPYDYDFAIPSVIAALSSLIGIIAALISRIQSGKGQVIEASLYRSALYSEIALILGFIKLPRKFTSIPMLGTPFIGIRETKQDFIFLHVGLPRHLKRFLEKIQDLGYEQEYQQLKKHISPQTYRDPTLLSGISEAKKLRTILNALLVKKTAIEWEALLGSDLCCCKIRSFHEWLTDPNLLSGTIVTDPTPKTRMISSVVKYSNSEFSINQSEAEEVDFSSLITHWKQTKTETPPHKPTQNLTEKSGKEIQKDPNKVLSGIRVLDLSRIIAGPQCTRILAEFGAEVIRVENKNLHVDWTQLFHLGWNGGKKTIQLDLENPKEIEEFWTIVENFKPDVVVHNYRSEEVATRLNVGYESFKSRFPKIIYTHLNAFGMDGNYHTRPGFEQILQAISGIQNEYVKGKTPKLFPMVIVDLICGYLGAFGTLSALYSRLTQGEGQKVNTCLSTASLLVQIKSFSRFNFPQQKIKLFELMTRFKKKFGAISFKEKYRRELEQIPAFQCLSFLEFNSPEYINQFKQILEKISIPDLNSLLKKYMSPEIASKIGIMERRKLKNIIEDTQTYDPHEIKYIRRINVPNIGEITWIDTPLIMSETPLLSLGCPKKRGADTTEILNQFGVPETNKERGWLEFPKEILFPKWLLSTIKWALYLYYTGYFAEDL